MVTADGMTIGVDLAVSDRPDYSVVTFLGLSGDPTAEVETFKLWLNELVQRRYANGAELADRLGHATTGDARSACYDAHLFLCWAESEGLIERGANRDVGNRHTRQAMFFDVNRDLTRRDSPLLYGFSPTPKLLERGERELP